MKVFLFGLFFFLSSPIYAAIQCGEDWVIHGKEGSKFVILEIEGEKIKLNSQDQHSFSHSSGTTVTFENGEYRYVHPRMVDGNPAQLFKGKKLVKCL